MLYDMLKCFIITAIGNPETETRRHADQVEEHIIRNALLELKFDVENNLYRADKMICENKYTGMIDHLKNDHLCISDITGLNVNVMFEYGFRKATGLPMIVLASKDDPPQEKLLPFDISTDSIIRYDLTDLDSISTAKSELKSYARTYLQLFIEEADYKKRDLDNILDELRADVKEIKELFKNNNTISNQTGSSP